jgi:hypothetical protein
MGLFRLVAGTFLGTFLGTSPTGDFSPIPHVRGCGWRGFPKNKKLASELFRP